MEMSFWVDLAFTQEASPEVWLSLEDQTNWRNPKKIHLFEQNPNGFEAVQ